ncbi:MAG: galactose-1-phosphate uridylyltransferase [Verrucomicrobiota bacterium]
MRQNFFRSMFQEYPHRRYNPLLEEWIFVSPHRTQLPWKGQQEMPHTEKRPSYDPNCYLCPGNTHANGERNPHYTDTYVFDNDFAALLNDTPENSSTESSNSLFRAESVRGTSKRHYS